MNGNKPRWKVGVDGFETRVPLVVCRLPSNSLLSFLDIKNRLETLASIFASPANLQNFACHAVFVVFPEQKFRDHSLAFSVLPSVCCCCCSVIDHPSIRRRTEEREGKNGGQVRVSSSPFLPGPSFLPLWSKCTSQPRFSKNYLAKTPTW